MVQSMKSSLIHLHDILSVSTSNWYTSTYTSMKIKSNNQLSSITHGKKGQTETTGSAITYLTTSPSTDLEVRRSTWPAIYFDDLMQDKYSRSNERNLDGCRVIERHQDHLRFNWAFETCIQSLSPLISECRSSTHGTKGFLGGRLSQWLTVASTGNNPLMSFCPSRWFQWTASTEKDLRCSPGSWSWNECSLPTHQWLIWPGNGTNVDSSRWKIGIVLS
jgi:hypothetical protein